MMRFASVLCALSFALSPALVEAAPKKGKAAKAAKKEKKEVVKQASEQTKKAIGELAGRYKWGMSSKQVMDIITGDIKKSYDEKFKKTKSPAEQDRLRSEMNTDITKVRDSLVKFDGQKTSWDISLVDKEFAHRNQESMLIHWEPTQRRFLFFHDDKLWKQFIALNAELFEGKTFKEFADMVAARYGEPKRVTSTDIRGKEVLDHLEWPPAGDFFLTAVDHTNLYGNYCLVLAQKSVLDDMAKRRAEANPDKGYHSGIDQVMKGAGKGSKPSDGNTDVVDQITGKQQAKPKLFEDDDSGPVAKPSAVASDSDDDKPKPKKKAPAKKKGGGKKKKK
jgi:hypothetical protein